MKRRVKVLALFFALAPVAQVSGQTSMQDVPPKATERVRNGNALYDKGKYDEAVKEYEAAIALAPGWYEPHYELGQTYYQMKRGEDSRRQYELAVERDPRCWICYQGLGNLADDAGDRVLALQQYQKAVDLAPNRGQPRYNLAITYFRMQKVDEAISALKGAERLEPAYASPYFMLGTIYYEQKKFYLAFDQLFQATKLEKNGPRFDKAKELIDVHVVVDEKLKGDAMGSHMSYCIAPAGAMAPEEYRKRFPKAETYVNDLAEEEYVLGTFAMIVSEMSQDQNGEAEFRRLVAINKAGYLAPFILLTSERFRTELDQYQEKNPGRMEQFRKWASDNKISLKPIHPRCEVNWMGQTW